MNFTPKTEEELARESLLSAGTYPFEVLEAIEQVSKKGNEMIKLKLNVFGQSGEQVHVYDYLLESMAFKLRHFAEAAGLLRDYEAGKLDAQACVGKNGFVKLEIEEQLGYVPRNTVKDYAKPDASLSRGGNGGEKPVQPPIHNARHTASMAAQAPAVGQFDDDIPF